MCSLLPTRPGAPLRLRQHRTTLPTTLTARCAHGTGRPGVRARCALHRRVVRETRIAWNEKGSLRSSEAEITLLEARHLPVADECLLRSVAQRSHGFTWGKAPRGIFDNLCQVQGYQAAPRAKCLSTSRPSPTPTPSQTAVRFGMRTFFVARLGPANACLSGCPACCLLPMVGHLAECRAGVLKMRRCRRATRAC